MSFKLGRIFSFELSSLCSAWPPNQEIDDQKARAPEERRRQQWIGHWQERHIKGRFEGEIEPLLIGPLGHRDIVKLPEGFHSFLNEHWYYGDSRAWH